MSVVKLSGITKEFKGTLSKLKLNALVDIDLEIKEGEVVCLLGPSGSGKTTLLRIIAGIESETSGTIELNNQPINNVNSQNREIGFVFQNIDAVYPHLTVFENVAFPLKLKLRKGRNLSISNQVKDILRKVDLTDKERSYPHELSGGEKQRVALARALVYTPKILLLDEPLSSLDNILKKEISDLIKILHDNFNTTILYVTHDEREAIEIADRIVVLSDGRILQQGTFNEILENPVNSQVAKIIGGWNILNGQYSIKDNNYFITINGTEYLWDDIGASTNKEIEIGLPISNIELNEKESPANLSILSIQCHIKKIINFQSRTIIEVNVGNDRLKVEKDNNLLNHFRKEQIAYMNIDKKSLKIW